MNRLLEALQQHRRATNGVRSGFPKQLARASQQHFSRSAAPLLFLLSSMTLLFKRMYVLFSPTPALELQLTNLSGDESLACIR